MLQELKNAILPTRLVAEVISENIDGTVTVTTGSGFSYNAIGSGTVGSYVYTQGGMVIGVATSLPHGVIDI